MLRRATIAAVTVAALSAAGSATAAGAPCGALVSDASLRKAVGKPHVRLVHERFVPFGPTTTLPYYSNGEDIRLLACQYLLYTGHYSRRAAMWASGRLAVITLVFGEVKQLPVAANDIGFLEIREDPEWEGATPPYPLPLDGAEASQGFEAQSGLGTWWSLTLGRKLEIEVEWRKHHRAWRAVIERLGAELVPNVVVGGLKVPS